MTRRGKGDEGLAQDLLPLAEKDTDPPVDWSRLADLLNEAEAAPDVATRDLLLGQATALAGDHLTAKAFVASESATIRNRK